MCWLKYTHLLQTSLAASDSILPTTPPTTVPTPVATPVRYPPLTNDPNSTREDALVEAYNAKFRVTVDYPMFSMLLKTPSPMELAWYKQWKMHRSLVKQVPAHFWAAGLTPAEWQASLPSRADRSRIRQAYAERRKTADDLEMQALDASEAAELALTDSPLKAVVEAGYNQLPPPWKVWVEGFDATDHPWAVRFAMAVLRRTLVYQLQGEPGTAQAPPPTAASIPGRPDVGCHGDWIPDRETVRSYINRKFAPWVSSL